MNCASAQGNDDIDMEYWFDHSQQQWFVGVSGGYGMGFYGTDIRMHDIKTPDTVVQGQEYLSLNGAFYRVGINADVLITQTKRGEIFLTGGIGYIHSSAESGEPEMYNGLLVIDQNEDVSYSVPKHTLSIATDQIDASLGIGFNPKNFVIDIALCAAYTLNAETIDSVVPTLVDSSPFPTGAYNYTQQTTYSKEEHSTWMYGLQLTLRYLIDLDPVQIHIAPNYRYYFSSLHTFADARVQTLSLDLRVGIAGVMGNRDVP